ncbi:MAG: TolC family protein [Crocinitomicaceae bacterium]|nr:TolC family protein [Crocinitomicaceae bacterium]
MAETAISNSKTEIKAMVREAYYNVLVADKNLSLVDSVLINTQKLWKEVEIFEKNGMIKPEEVMQLELAYNRILSTRQNAFRQTEIARNLLKLQMGYDFDKSITLTENLDQVLASIEQANPVTEEFNVAQNQNYILMEQQQQLDGYNLRNEKAKYLPSVGAFLLIHKMLTEMNSAFLKISHGIQLQYGEFQYKFQSHQAVRN